MHNLRHFQNWQMGEV